MTSRLALGMFASLAACQWGGGPGQGPSGQRADAAYRDAPRVDSAIDAPMVDAMIDAPMIDSSIDAAPSTLHLVLSELAVTPDGHEFIEIYNPTAQAVDLSTYYVSNHGSYFRLPVNGAVMPFAHFVARFPMGASIAPGQAITVATQGAAAFMMRYGVPPTYSITDGTMTSVLVENTPRLTDSGALVVLFQWDGTSGVVRDVDMMISGIPNATNRIINKSGVMQNGATYATDANTVTDQPSAPGIGTSTKRIALEAGNETQSGGNGITGHDETSEKTELTWDTSFSAPTPGTVPML